ncbi:MAG: hypothetical protein ABFD07_16580 [Methanobacterium sp.]
MRVADRNNWFVASSGVSPNPTKDSSRFTKSSNVAHQESPSKNVFILLIVSRPALFSLYTHIQGNIPPQSQKFYSLSRMHFVSNTHHIQGRGFLMIYIVLKLLY